MSRRLPGMSWRVLAVLVMAVAFMCLVVPAYGFEATPSVTLDTHDIEAASTLWWTRNLTPSVAFSSTLASGLPAITGYYYDVDRSPVTVPDVFSDSAPKAEAPLTLQTLDMAGLGRLFPSPLLFGVSNPVEGVWYIHVRSYIATVPGMSDVTANGHFGVDVTKPAAVQGIKVDTTGWSDVWRHKITWTDLAYQRYGGGNESGGYDSLSGDKKWAISVNGAAPIVWDRYLYSPIGVATVEQGLKPGKNVVNVYCIDYGGNYSPPSPAYVYIDVDVPTVAITAPTSSTGWIRGVYKFAVSAKDAGGIRSVVFKIDGITRQSSTSSSMSFDTRRLVGGWHTLQVVVTDMFGRTASASRAFKTDNTPIAISSLSGAPNPFYPIIRDGYKDNFTVKFNTSEAATNMYLRIWSGSSLYREQHYVNVSAGTIALVWNGASSGGTIKAGTFNYQVVAYDRAGNVTATGMHPVTATTAIFLVPIGPGQVKVIRR